METSKQMFSTDGMTIPDSIKVNYSIVSAYTDEVKNAKIDLTKTYTNIFAEEAAKRLN
jgi:NitT/TauT family transport system substrate-binding protein